MKAILGFTRMSVRGINKVKRELGFVLMALNIRNSSSTSCTLSNTYQKADFHQTINRNQLFTLPKNLMSQLIFIHTQTTIQIIFQKKICSLSITNYLIYSKNNIKGNL